MKNSNKAIYMRSDTNLNLIDYDTNIKKKQQQQQKKNRYDNLFYHHK